MRKVSKFIISGVFLGMLLSYNPAWAAEGTKIGYVDAIKIFDDSKEGRRVQGILKEYVKSRQTIIDLEEQEIKDKELELKKQLPVLSEETLKSREMELQRKLVSFQKKVNDLSKEIEDKKMEVLKDFNIYLEKIVEKVAKDKGYHLILDKNPGTGVVVYGESSLDITDSVLKEMEKGKAPGNGKN